MSILDCVLDLERQAGPFVYQQIDCSFLNFDLQQSQLSLALRLLEEAVAPNMVLPYFELGTIALPFHFSTSRCKNEP